ncbi:hypothetical protein KIN20_003433 [Parelaphostrongylus tenuis]|uniref:Uncharacterized protein n=1 Tax=Parelaphostrongylus tenuis TaxID=148309 RepID=A0AAD5LZ55_PARTN|nr:hypothetical protein KIN20_003433 [Parelaphostrongylus tenuis]
MMINSVRDTSSSITLTIAKLISVIRLHSIIWSGFVLPTAVAFTTSTTAPSQLPGRIATTSDGAKSFVYCLVMQTIRSQLTTVIDVHEQQGRSAGLHGIIISMILSQLTIQISYDPLECRTVTVRIL